MPIAIDSHNAISTTTGAFPLDTILAVEQTLDRGVNKEMLHSLSISLLSSSPIAGITGGDFYFLLTFHIIEDSKLNGLI